MKTDVVLSLQGKQFYDDQDPEVIELVTDGVLEDLGEERWELSYQESDLTGLTGTTTTFLVEPGKVTLRRNGALRSEMVFQEGVCHESLYEMDFGALLVVISPKKVYYALSHEGGCIDLIYGIEIEQSAAGRIEYHLTIRKK